jgi:Txe/YoeB family toxin of Txe-Axe toxin-antitoxin module
VARRNQRLLAKTKVRSKQAPIELWGTVLPSARGGRIDDEHRLVYLVDGDDVVILQCRYHYER